MSDEWIPVRSADELYRSLTELEDDALDPGLPSDELHRRLRAVGLDPDEIGRAGQAFVRGLHETSTDEAAKTARPRKVRA